MIDKEVRVLGIDSSLTGTGLAEAEFSPWPPSSLPRRDDEPCTPFVELSTVGASRSKPGDTWLAKARRVHEVLEQIAEVLDDGRWDAVGLEELAYGAQGTALVVLHWLWGEVVNLVRLREIPLYLVNVAGVKKFATGKGNAKKDQVMLAMANRYPQFGIADNNQSDALAVSMMTSRIIGAPFDTMPVAHHDALKKVVLQ